MPKPSLHTLTALSCCLAAAIAVMAAGDSVQFAILGDRNGDAQPGIYEQVWKETAAEQPAFVVTTGDSIEGMDDATAEIQWQEVERIWKPYSRYSLYLAPGNHDIWSAASELLYRKHAGHPPHYSFDYGPVHVTILDNSRADELAPEELAFLQADLKSHGAAPVKLIVSHRPSWLVKAALGDTDFELHRLARQYGVQYVIAGHVHQIIRLELQGITYLSMPSAGGHLRLSKLYEDGWFFGHARVQVDGRKVDFQLEELKPPHGQGRVSRAWDWGMAGLVKR